MLFSPIQIRNLKLRNRVMMSPMCMYSAGDDGKVTDWHRLHYPTRAVGGVGLVMLEATAVESRGRISRQDLGLWDDAQVEGMAEIVRACHRYGAAVGVQLAHAGRKAKDADPDGPGQAVAPSAEPFAEGWPTPRAMTAGDLAQVVDAFAQAARRALAAGFDVVEIHMAHGYLLHEFLSPLVNRREDEFGGSLANRLRVPLMVAEAVRRKWPEERPLFVRLSSVDHAPGGLSIEETVEIAKALKETGVDLFDCSSGGAVPVQPKVWPGYQVPYAHQVRRGTGSLTAAVGLITKPDHAEAILQSGHADLIALGRELLRNPYWPLHAGRKLGDEVPWPTQYLRART